MAAYRVTLERVEATRRQLGPGPWTTQALHAAGWTAGTLESAVTRGALQRVRRGMYAPPEDGVRRPGPARTVSIDQVHATIGGLSPRAAASHASAALLQGMWAPGPPARVVHATIPGQAERWSTGLRVHASRLPEEYVTLVDGTRVTTVARTAVDLARGMSLPHALVAVDGGYRRMVELERPGASRELRARTVPAETHARVAAELEAAFAVTWSWPGTRVVRAALDLVDPASESPFESWSRGWILAVGLPAPTVNAEVVGESGRPYVGDLVWRQQRLVGEADGVAKYGTDAAEVRHALTAERTRQADLEAAGWRFVRWVTGDPGAQIVARVARALYLPRVTPETPLLRARKGRFRV